MLTIRSEQMAAFSDYMLASFTRRLRDHLRSRFPAGTAAMSDEALEVAIVVGMDRAKGYGVTSENDIRRFMECAFLYNPHFDTDPATAWAGDILRRDDLSGSAKTDLIHARALAEEEA